jgi:hypothetical protein
LPPEKSEQGHIGSSPPEKGIWQRRRRPGSVNRRLSQRDQQMRNRHTTVARAAVFCRFLAGLSSVSSIDAPNLIGRFKKAGGNLTVYDAGPARVLTRKATAPLRLT